MNLNIRPYIFLFFSLCFFYANGQTGKAINVADFGAVKDSSADARNAVRRALEYCKANHASKIIFPKGRYDFLAGSCH
ncbi:MAG: hypothetical protein M3Z26_06925 [Bacteroidota bacterium]|nr:hypothetical protein [Bacteroidota bacterium]